MTDVSAGFVGREFSPRGTLGAVTARYGIPDPNVLCQVDLDDARKDAETPEARISQRERNGGLDAIPLAVMDLMVVRGMPQGHEGRGIVAWTKSLHSFILTGRQATYTPLKSTENGLPVSLQFVSAMHNKTKILTLAAQYEEHLGAGALAKTAKIRAAGTVGASLH